MALISGKIVILDNEDIVIHEKDLGNNSIEIDTTNVLPLVEIDPILRVGQVANTFIYTVDRANNVCRKDWTIRQLVPIDIPLTARQLRLGLIRNSIPLSSVQSAINTLPGPLKDEAQIYWEFSNEIHWGHPMTGSLMAMVGIEASNAASMWMTASTYER